MIDIDTVLEALDIDVVSSEVKRVVARCPFRDHEHEAQRPAFHLRPGDRDGEWIWTCFKGCGQGPLVNLVRRIKELDETAARRWLVLNSPDADSDFIIKQLNRPEVKIVMQPRLYWDDYNAQSATTTSQYILDRGFTIPTLKSWGVRYDAGSLALVFPVFSLEDKLVGLIRREVVTGALPNKYMYPLGFERRNHLFGANRHHSEDGEVILVEGPLDCIWLHQCGITSAVALMGASCSAAQRRIIARLGHRVVLALDNDEAGFEAMNYLERFLSPDFNVSRVQLPEEIEDVEKLTQDEAQVLFRAQYARA